MAGPAGSLFSIEPVDPAGPGAERAVFEQGEAFLDPLREQTPVGEIKIGCLECLSAHYP